jgi:peptide/nickel transport system substrate-binding protein
MNFKLLFSILTLLLLVFSCKDNESHSGKKISEKNGGTFAMAEYTEIGNIFPLLITMQHEGIIVSQMHEGLVRLNPFTLEETPGLAKSWEISLDGKIITFHLNNDAYFQDDQCFPNGKGTKITTKDIKFTFELLATPSNYNYHFSTILKDRVLGANDFYNKKAKTISGLHIINDSTFEFLLEKPNSSFMHLLSNPAASIISEVAFKAYGTEMKVGAGPFKYDVSSTSKNIVLLRNPNYYAKDSAGFSLPYLDTVIVKIFPSIEEGLANFENGNIDLINTLPSLRVKEIVEKNINEFASSPPKSILQHEAEMLSQFYSFNTKRAPFNNIKVRQAINYAIDRDKIVENILQGQAISSATNGVTPNTFSGYNVSGIVGYTLDVPKAKKLLSDAGFPNGKGFPEVQLLVNSGNSRNSSVAVEVQKQLKEHLNININFESLPNVQKYELELHGKGDLFRDAWVADYASPESFLSLFISEGVPADSSASSFPNTSRYQNSIYDQYFFKGRNSNNRDTSYFYFMRAEQLLMNEAVVIPLWYEGSYRLLSNKVKDLNLNPMRYYDLTKTYITK